MKGISVYSRGLYMEVLLSKKDKNRLESLFLTLENNISIADMFLEFCSHYGFVDEKRYKSEKDKEEAFAKEFLNFFEIEIENKEDMNLYFSYIKKAIKKVDINYFKLNKYNQIVRPNIIKYGKYSLEYKKYYSLQPFVYDDVLVDENTFVETSSIAFSEEEFSYLVIAKNNINWMCITPNEINTMQKYVDECKGKVLTFGLGLGYYAFMASEKDDVESVTIIENDVNIIKIFNENIIKFFPHKEKIKIINQDAFSFYDKNNLDEYNYIFVDIYHDAEDGLPLYLEFKKREKYSQCKINYWLENSIIAMFRRLFIILIREQYYRIDVDYNKKGNDLDKIISVLYEYTKTWKLTTFNQIVDILKTKNLLKIINEIV